MPAAEFQRRRQVLLLYRDVRARFLAYQASFPHVAAYLMQSPHLSDGDGPTGTNLASMFLRQCRNLLKSGGTCAIIVPTGVMTDISGRGLRESLL